MGEKANRPKSFRSPKSASIAASCLHPSEKYQKRFILEQIIFNKENLLSLRHPSLLPYFDKTTPNNFNRPCRADRCRKVKKIINLRILFGYNIKYSGLDKLKPSSKLFIFWHILTSQVRENLYITCVYVLDRTM